MNIDKLVDKCEKELQNEFKKVDEVCTYNSKKVLDAFRNNKISETHFNSTTGYGYNDIGRDAIEKVFCDIFNCESALVRNQFISGSHALNVALFSVLRPNDILLSITGLPYDTLHEVIGIKENPSSLKSYGVKYDQIDLIDNDFDREKIIDYLKNNKVKVIEIQRSKGYSERKSISFNKIEKIVNEIRKIDKDVIILVDNCYCEFVTKHEVSELDVDLVVGSLIKNLGAGIAPNGAYIVGKKKYVDLAGERLTLPGEGRDVGPTLGINKDILKGLFFAPTVVASSVKTAILTSKVMEELGYKVEPRYNEDRVDIVQNIIFNDEKKLIDYCVGIQKGSPIDSFAVCMPTDMPGYDDKIIMASGSFTQGSSIELSCDGPLRNPYIAYQQGSLTYEYGKLGLISALNELLK